MTSKALVAASTKPMILAILKKGENYGYRIIQNVREISGGEIDWSEPMVYPVLKRMEREGLIESDWKITESGRLRKYYRLTPKGTEELEIERKTWNLFHAAFRRILEMAEGAG